MIKPTDDYLHDRLLVGIAHKYKYLCAILYLCASEDYIGYHCDT